ncbi:MSC_0622 family F1-like ATPase gamma subunit [Mesomycoplasma bovoculi]|uniref:Uncharacterized protein n=1 Tax=Mesomycoplasma bovoculi M165/69 TaxID=743966 RepID=W5USX4_9BACT|nr:hypothetical protein [Mesomycoplasma bovoculi]AHH45221.1 hypothetical protein MYB_01050 [Mesomycoplasma bovoculi M165/69]
MNLNEKKEKLINLAKINELVTLNRNISLIEINQLLKTIRERYDFFLIGQLFLNQSNQDNLSSIVSQAIKKITKKSNKTLWVYPSSEEKYTQNFFEQIEKTLSSKFKKGDQIITIGTRALNFAKKNGYEVVAEFAQEKNLFSVAQKIAHFIDFGIKDKQFQEVKFAIYSNKIHNFLATIYPLNQFNFNVDIPASHFEIVKNKVANFKFFPNYDEFWQAQLISYFAASAHILLLESQFIVYKNKLIHENSLLKEIEEKMQKLKTTILKIERELEIEELNLIKPKAKRIF